MFSQTEQEKSRFLAGLQTATSIPFIDDIEDYILEAIWCYAKNIPTVDPFFNTRSKKLYDVVDRTNHIGWSVKSLQYNFSPNCEFELVIQRADIFKKARELGFDILTKDTDPQTLGRALLCHWQRKIDTDAISQEVTDKRVMVLLKKTDKINYALYESVLHTYSPDELTWRWADNTKTGLHAIVNGTNFCAYRWYPNQKQFFERFRLPDECWSFSLNPHRLDLETTVDIFHQYFSSHELH